MPADKKVIGLSVGVGLLGSGLIATVLYFLLLKKPDSSPSPNCPPCKCYAEAVSQWTPQS
jgi:hypothetical protein